MSKILPQGKNMTKLQTERKLHPSAEHKKTTIFAPTNPIC